MTAALASPLDILLDYIPPRDVENALAVGAVDGVFLAALPARTVHWCRTAGDIGPLVRRDGRERRFVMIDAPLVDVPAALPDGRRFDLIVLVDAVPERDGFPPVRTAVDRLLAPDGILVSLHAGQPGAPRFPYTLQATLGLEVGGRPRRCDIHAAPARDRAPPPAEPRPPGLTVSAIVVNHNYGHLLAEAIDSVLAQTWPVDEVIVIDDASQDRSREVIKGYRSLPAGCPPVRPLFNIANLGVAETRRKALLHSTGDIVVFLDADDRLRADMVERTLPLFAARPDVDVVYTDAMLFGSRVKDKVEAIRQFGRYTVEPAAEGFHRCLFPEFGDGAAEAIREFNFIHVSSPFRRTAAARAGGYRHHPDAPEDWYFYARVLLSGGKAVRVPLPLLEYRQHSGGQDSFARRLVGEVELLRRHVHALETRLSALERR